MVDNLGSGISLDKSFDFQLTPDGDIASVSGGAEINKDLGFQLSIILDQYRGAPLTDSVKTNIKEDTVATILSDSRVRAVNQNSVRIGEGDGSITIIADYITNSAGQEELVFELQ